MDNGVSSGESSPNNLASTTGVAVEVISDNELSYEEQKEREYLERIVERKFYEAGKALQTLRDKKLYRNTHSSFDEYVRYRFGYKRTHSYQLIDAAKVVDNLKCPPLADILPTSEKQVRPLSKLNPQEQRQCWQQAVEAAGNKTPSGKIVRDIVDRIRERKKVPNPYQVGEVCVFLPKGNPELRGKSGCWGIVNHIGEYSCTLQAWDGEYTVKIENLSLVELTDGGRNFMQELCLRLNKIYLLPDRDTTIDSFLASLGKQAKPYLTPIQEKLLYTIEYYYQITRGMQVN